ncbi:MAG: hemolysin III family protein [Propionibacteriaceae bacterium]|nr:hemolysin III family protein [Propionibacteriaceae bacterium]
MVAYLDAWGHSLKPHLRGWLHAGAVPLMITGGVILIVLASTGPAKAALAVYLASALILFGTSATYHIGRWTPRVSAVLRRIDHSNIFLFIAGTYTPLAVLLLQGTARLSILAVIWALAGLGVCFRVFWMSAPRWLYVGLYVLMGWAAVWWLPQFWATGGPVVVGLVLGGGVAYSIGALIYARRRPDPIPRWFGFHELFHSCTLLASALHFSAIAVALRRA